MSELVFLHVGQCGTQVGSRLWKLFGKEHNVNGEGYYNDQELFNNTTAPLCSLNLKSLYDESIREENKLEARCLFIDTDECTVEQVRKDPSLSGLLKNENMIKGKEDSASNFARGKITIGGVFRGYIKERVRKMVEACDSPGGFVITHSMEGGTGSGTTSFIAEILENDFPELNKTSFSVFPSENFKTEVVEPYNTALVLSDLKRNNMTNIFNLDNESIYNVCKSYGISNPNYRDVNDVISQTISTFTLPTRFNNSTCPILSPYKGLNIIGSTFKKVEDVNSEINIENLFTAGCKMSGTDHLGTNSILMDVALRGNFTTDHTLKFLDQFEKLKTAKFENFHQEIFSKKAENLSDSSITFSDYIQVYNNSSSIADPIKQLQQRFLNLFYRRSFVFWYVGEGMEEGEFSEAMDEVEKLIEDYSSVKSGQPIPASKLKTTVVTPPCVR